MTQTTTNAEPAILTASTYYWQPACNASFRRRNEERHAADVAAWLEGIGFSVVARSAGYVEAKLEDITVVFRYSESRNNVYKRLSVTNAGKRSNIELLRKIAAKI